MKCQFFSFSFHNSFKALFWLAFDKLKRAWNVQVLQVYFYLLSPVPFARVMPLNYKYSVKHTIFILPNNNVNIFDPSSFQEDIHTILNRKYSCRSGWLEFLSVFLFWLPWPWLTCYWSLVMAGLRPAWCSISWPWSTRGDEWLLLTRMMTRSWLLRRWIFHKFEA